MILGSGSKSSVFSLSSFTPTVYIFGETENNVTLNVICHSNITQRSFDLREENIGADDFPKSDSVYSIFYTKMNSDYLCERHIQRKTASAILF